MADWDERRGKRDSRTPLPWLERGWTCRHRVLPFRIIALPHDCENRPAGGGRFGEAVRRCSKGHNGTIIQRYDLQAASIRLAGRVGGKTKWCRRWILSYISPTSFRRYFWQRRT